MKSNLNILFTSGWYPNRVVPTLGNFVQKHAEAVALHSNVAALHITSDSNCKKEMEITQAVINNVFTVNVYYKKVSGRLPGISVFLKMISHRKAFKLGLQKIDEHFNRIDLVHHNILYPSGIQALFLKRKRGIPFVVSEHSTSYLPSKNYNPGVFEKMLVKKIASEAAFVLPVSVNLWDSMKSAGIKANYEIVYNVVDTKLFRSNINKPANKKIKFLHVSTLDDAHKNISGMLRAAEKLGRSRNDFECYFIGDGDYTKHMETARLLGIYNSLAFFSGTKTTREIAELMRDSDCFLLFSNYENLPVVLIEAFASGLPVISSDVGGIAEHLSPERGILVKAGDEDALTNEMNTMTDSLQQEKYNKADISRYAAEHFSYEKVSNKFHHLYRQIINRNV